MIFEDIKNIINNVQATLREFFQLSFYPQAAKRCIEVVTEASFLVTGQVVTDGCIITRIKSRQTLPSFETKPKKKII